EPQRQPPLRGKRRELRPAKIKTPALAPPKAPPVPLAPQPQHEPAPVPVSAPVTVASVGESTPAPAPTPAAPTPAPPPKPSGPLDALVTLSVTDVEGALPRADVERAVERVLPAFRACYVQAAARAQKNAGGTLAVKFAVDETGAARDAEVGSGPLPELAACVRTAARRIRTQAPDVGGVRVWVTLTFSSLGP